MTQTYTDPVALKRLTGGLCPECGELPSSHPQPGWKCDLREDGVLDRLQHYRTGPTYGFERDRMYGLALAQQQLERAEGLRRQGGDGLTILMLAQEVVLLRAALDDLDAMEPDKFKTGQGHLPPAFREVNFKQAFQHVVGVVNKVLHGTDANGNPLPTEDEETGQ